MNPERLEQIETLYNDALELEPSERNAFLDRACCSDVELRKEIASLLMPGRTETFLDKDAMHFAAESIAKEAACGTDVCLPVGTKLGNYELLCLLGRGGMGEVYRARDMKLGRDVAIKVLSGEPLPYAE